MNRKIWVRIVIVGLGLLALLEGWSLATKPAPPPEAVPVNAAPANPNQP